jgi:hypothetical protein
MAHWRDLLTRNVADARRILRERLLAPIVLHGDDRPARPWKNLRELQRHCHREQPSRNPHH